MFIAYDKDGTLHTHTIKPIRAQYGRGVKDTFWESNEHKKEASESLKKKYSFMRWEHEPLHVKEK